MSNSAEQQVVDGPIFAIDRVLAQGSWLDHGMFVLATCPQAAFTRYHRIIRGQSGLPQSGMLMCGMALGCDYLWRIENPPAPAREPAGAFAPFLA